MCAAIDMLSSGQFFGRSPPAGFLADYAPPRRQVKITARGYSAPCFTALKPVKLTLKSAPRSCIRMQTEKEKKRVVFADAKGLALEEIKVMTEPSHVPPFWALMIAASPPMERKATPPVDTWKLKFVQPASDYLEFRRRVTSDCVSLENVIIKQKECAVDGTVKVKNLDFTKEVFIRTSSDGWRTHEDTFCAFVETGPLGANGMSAYDTFGFRLQLPIHSRRLDFCVCFQCKGEEYWDNNRGKNYTIEKSFVKTVDSCARFKYGNTWINRNATSDVPYW